MVNYYLRKLGAAIVCLPVISSCQDQPAVPAAALIDSLHLKKGQLIACGPADSQLGTVQFAITGDKAYTESFNLGVKLLHSFEYDEAEKVFAAIIDQMPSAYMAYWGIAMSNFHPLWSPPLPEELKKGLAAIAIAQGLHAPSAREEAYLNAIAAFYTDWQTVDHRTRCLRFETAMRQLREQYGDDLEATILYTLALDAAADPADKTYQKQLQAGKILDSLYPRYPNHPGIVHYLIHTYDSPELASRGLEAARRYASVAPSSAHALHMPSHIFTRLGLWEECIQSNLGSVTSAQCYAQAAGIKGHWDEEMHGLDYLLYGYLQRGDNIKARAQLAYLNTIKEVHPSNFKVAYAFAAIPSRMVLENRQWREATALPMPVANFNWTAYPWQASMLYFARALGAAHTGNSDTAQKALTFLQHTYDTLLAQKDQYKANQVLVQLTAARGWWQWHLGHKDSSLLLLEQAAALEDKTEKHPVTPSELLPARELLGDLLLAWHEPALALATYEANLQRHPNRFNGLYGAAQAAEQVKDTAKARQYYMRLLSTADTTGTDRREIRLAKQFVWMKKKS